MKEKRRNKHKYSSILLLVFLAVCLMGVGLGIDPRELNTVCAENNSVLIRLNGTWGCQDANKPFAEMWGRRIDNVTITDVDTYYNITDMTLGDYYKTNFSNSTFIILHSGYYSISSQFAFSGGANTEYHMAVGKNGIREEHCHSERKLSSTGDVGSASVTCKDYFAVDDEITIMIENVVNNKDPEIHSINLNIELINYG